MDQFASTLTSAGLIFYFMRFLKTVDWYASFVKAFPMADRWVHRFVAGFGSMIAALGITFAYSGSWATGWDVSFTIPDGFTLLSAAWQWVQVFTTQQLAYDATRRPAAMPHDQKVTA